MTLSPVTLLALLSCLVASSLASPRPRPEAYNSYYDYYRPYYGYYRYATIRSSSPTTAVLYRYYGDYGECDLDSHCSYSTACHNNYCRDPCIGACGYNANCRVSQPM